MLKKMIRIILSTLALQVLKTLFLKSPDKKKDSKSSALSKIR